MPDNSELRILVVDDEKAIRHFLKTSLHAQGFTISEAQNGEEALTKAVKKRPDLIILDIGLPDTSGMEVIKEVREWSEIPILILSVMDQESQKIKALDAGADDYLTKPFGLGELMARIRAVMRRVAEPTNDPTFTNGDLDVNLSNRQVQVSGQEVSLTPTEYDLLRIFIQHAGKVLTHRHLIKSVWGGAYESERHLLRVNISNLRKKIEPDPSRPQFIITEPGVGYRLQLIEAEV